jgi:hypothetical protein
MADGTITPARGAALLRKPPAPTPQSDEVYYEAGGSTFHVHTCSATPPHQWKCNSPYCATLTDLCPDHGGPEPVSVGREPWKR